MDQSGVKHRKWEVYGPTGGVRTARLKFGLICERFQVLWWSQARRVERGTAKSRALCLGQRLIHSQ